MLLSRLLFPRIKFYFSFRCKTTDINLVDEINRIKSKDLLKIFDQEQTKRFLQLRRSFGGKFQSLEQLQNDAKIQIDFDKFFSYLLSLKTRTSDSSSRIHIEPRLTPTTATDIDSVCSLDYTASYLNWTIVKTTDDKTKFQVKQWNSIEIDLDRKYNFVRTFNQLSDSLKTLPLNKADVLLVEQPTYRFSKPELTNYITQLQQIRAVFNTLLHCHASSKRPVYHISGRDVGLHFGLFVGNEQSSAEFFLTNLIFHNVEGKQMLSLDINDDLKTNFHQIHKRQREPMAQCLLRAVAFLQYVNEKKDNSSKMIKTS